jgi:uncharacterized protein (DUF779 family)
VPLLIDAEQYERWRRPQFALDIAPGGFSLEARRAVRFVSRSPG